ncbi:YSIRK-type signal peptide-containing protein [Staphylococcus chromogenes]|uniref:YSIRK-type signal peptide-containing protein n=1 Tax=Staphylococcus chromogenes TaxID=46126 RepID=UPI000E6A8C0F|nr:YSIRK-type signal peptide-containing protein [Staphylococcus chromogenes]MCE4966553.1 YSIRK-type signal peptide-containing protein [Staphylococcus chromogenes]MDU0476095.1 YSIRK-type signal peptide-containing protein [Staphylococcus chromogenes]RIM07688.1 YSIRK-type signal peptide-containing protein [Staphylococcus chromogenes]
MFKKQHFGIRKFTVGAASIAVGATLFFGANASADAAEVDGQAWTNDNLGESYGTAYVESNGNAEGQAYEPTLAESNAEGSAWVADNAVSSNVDGQAWTNDNLGESYGSAYVDANGNVDGQAWEPTLAEGPETGSAWVENNLNETVTATGEPAYAEPLPEGHIGINGEPAYAEAPPKGSLDGYLYDHGTGVTHHVPKGSLDGYYYDHGTGVTHELPEGDIAINGTGVTHELPEGDISLNGTGVTHELPEGTLDTDNDGYTDDVEIAEGTSTTDASITPAATVDTDFDGYTDAEEVAAGTNLYDAASTPVETAVGQEAIAADAHVANEATAQGSVETTPAQAEGQAEGQALPETGSTEQGTLFGGLVAFIGAVLAFFGLRRKA